MSNSKIFWEKREYLETKQEAYSDDAWYKVPVDPSLKDPNEAWREFVNLKHNILKISYPGDLVYGEFDPGKSLKIADSYRIGD